MSSHLDDKLLYLRHRRRRLCRQAEAGPLHARGACVGVHAEEGRRRAPVTGQGGFKLPLSRRGSDPDGKQQDLSHRLLVAEF